MSLIDPTQIAGARILLAEIGVLDTLRAAATIAAAERRGEPFAALGPPDNENARLSREQIGPAILLYRALLALDYERKRALEVTERAVVAGAVTFLKQTIGRIDRDEIEAMNEAERDEFARSRGEKFFNATVEWNSIDEEAVDFTVTHCKFPPLCEAVGHPELAPLFCKGDAKFFGEVEEGVELIRPHMIATGASTCPFRIQFSDD